MDGKAPTYYTSIGQMSEESIFDIWENGRPYNDSITPAVHIEHYRRFIIKQITSLAFKDNTIFSLGCGNGFVEAELVQAGYSVSAIDIHKKAVQLSRSKGVNAFIKDFYDLEPSCMVGVGCVYADGFIGHLFDENLELTPFFDKIEALTGSQDVYYILSNDAPTNHDLSTQRHERVPAFWYLSIDYLVTLMAARHYKIISAQYYTYERPISGPRRRTIVSFKLRSE